jgi:hypothetical protein
MDRATELDSRGGLHCHTVAQSLNYLVECSGEGAPEKIELTQVVI